MNIAEHTLCWAGAAHVLYCTHIYYAVPNIM